MLFSKSLASRIGNKGIISLSVHPGAIMQTNLARSLSEIDFGGLSKPAQRENLDGTDDAGKQGTWTFNKGTGSFGMDLISRPLSKELLRTFLPHSMIPFL